MAVAGACGSSSTSGPTSSVDTGQKLAAACQENVAINQGFNQLFANMPGPDNGPPPPAVKQQLKDSYNRTLAKPIADIAANPPEEIKGDIRDVTAKLQSSIGTSGDPSAFFMDPNLQAKTTRIDLYFYDHCSGQRTPVRAVEYSFIGMPDRLPSGIANLKLTNSGKEDHELLVVTRKPGVTESFDQLLALPKEQAQAKTQELADIHISPGQSDATVAQLSPGQYLAICTVPKGSVGEKPGTGPPHFTLGMKHQFTVG